jgi:hypothetical protein
MIISFKLETITPKKAADCIRAAASHTNRPVSQSVVKRYANMMTAGEFIGHRTGETVKFDENDVLLDGQHRLHAIVHSNTTQKLWVARGIDAEVFRLLDQGKQRTLPDVMHIAGYPDPNVLASAGRMLWKQDVTGSPFVKPSGDDDVGEGMIFDHVNEKYNGDLQSYWLGIKAQLQKIQRKGLGGSAWMLYFAYRARAVDPELCAAFINHLADAAAPLPHSALAYAKEFVLKLRVEFERESSDSRVLKGRNKDLCDATITAYLVAWECAREGKRITSSTGFVTKFNRAAKAEFMGFV